MKTLKHACIALSLVVGLGSAYPALATSTGLQVLRSVAASIDVFIFKCPAGTVAARANVEDINPPSDLDARLKTQLRKGHRAALQEDVFPTETKGEGSAQSPSPSRYAVLSRRDGVYVVLFYTTVLGQTPVTGGQTNVSPEVYRGSVDCVLSGGSVHHPRLIPTQVQ